MRTLPIFLLLFAGCAGANRESADPSAPSDWARETLRTLSTEEKVGQLIYAKSEGGFVNDGDTAYRALAEAARRGRIGGVVFFRGDPFETAAIGNRLQELSELPLLMASDYEWGANMRVSGATRFPRAMAIGAGGTEADMEFQAEVTAREAKALGIHLLLNPVLDLNTNPRNAVINTRSFGEDAERAGALGVAFIRRAQALGVLTAVKHFPGHGATAVDSHIGLPVIQASRERLEAVELVPFRAAVDAGVAAVMPAHIAVPALGGSEDRPATVTKAILQDVLRGDLGFRGLVVSDALDMGGARQGAWDGEVAVEAIRAGVDLLLVPPDPLVTYKALLRAVERGSISIERLDTSVARVLEAKERLGLHRRRTVDLDALPLRLGDTAARDRVRAIADRTVTLIQDEEALLPFDSRAPPDILLVDALERRDRTTDSDVFADELRRRARRLRRARWSPDREGFRANPGEIVVVATYARTRSFMGRGEIPENLVQAVRDERSKGRPVVVASLGNPYVLSELPEASVLIATYDEAAASQEALARTLFGEVPFQGKLPVTLSERYPLGHGIPLDAERMKLDYVTRPEDVGMSAQALRNASKLLRDAIQSGAAPGAVVLVARRGRIVLEEAIGRMSYADDAAAVKTDTIYDLASLTKVIVTTTLSMMLHERGDLDLDAPVKSYIPQFQGGPKDTVLVKDLLAHSGGLLAWTELYEEFEGESPDDARVGYIASICQRPLEHPPRSKMVYTDLGILLLGEILERVTGKRLDVLAKEELFDPLGMTDVYFSPDPSLLSRIAPTERDPWRGRVVHGEVHDENAYGLGGVAPHAGLFATAPALAPFVQMLLNGGAYGGHRLLNGKTIELFTEPSNLVPGSSRALGWDTPSEPSSSGAYFSTESFGHTGFTGTSIWVDPEHELFVILLSNRVHPTRENRQIYDLRPVFHDAVMKSIVDVDVQPR